MGGDCGFLLHAGVLLCAGVDDVPQEDSPEGAGRAFALAMVSPDPAWGRQGVYPDGAAAAHRSTALLGVFWTVKL
jgi:hypothetical protein